METKFELITPEIAKKMLKQNLINNRIIDWPTIREYARQMMNGIWYEHTGESIKITENGTLVDGQHRLLALIEANVSLRFKVDYGVPEIAFKYIDSGKRRSAGDKFHCAGILNSRNMASGIIRYLVLKANRTIGNKGINVKTSKRNGYSFTELLDVYNQQPKIWDAALNMASNWYSKSGRLLKATEFLAFYMFLRDISEDDAFVFMEKFGEGINLSNNDPIKLLREKLTNAKLNPTMVLTGYVKTALIVKTWNYFRTNESIKVLRFSPDIDNFPIAK